MSAFLIALQFLTRLPISLPGMPAPAAVGRSLLSYPLVGLLLGALLLSAQWALQGTAPVLQAALLLILWVGLSGGLHLDGLADSADAWAGGYGDRERTLTIMQDPRSGPIAVVVLVLVLLLKFAALLTLLQANQPLALLLAPWLARGLLPLLFLSTPYVRPGGLGALLAAHLPRGELPRWLAGHALLLVLLLLLKFAALLTLLQANQPLALLLAPWLARGLLPLLFFSTPYVRPGGLGALLAAHLPRRELPGWLAGHALLLVLLTGWLGLLALLAALLLFTGLRRLMCQRLGGTTGDTAGALVELAEAAVLLALALVV